MARKAARKRWIGAWVVATVAVALVAQASEGHHGDAPSFASINWWAWEVHKPPMGWFLLDFFVFLGGLVYFTAKPLADAFSQRHTAIKRTIAEMASAHAKASSRQQTLRGQLAGLEAEVRQLLDSSRKDGEEERTQLVKDAKEYAERMGKDAGAIATQETERARLRLQQVVLRAALTRAQSLLHEQITAADQQTLIEQAITELESGRALDSLKRAKAGLTLVTGGAA